MSCLLSVKAISTTIVDVPSIRPHRFAENQINTYQSYLIVRVETADGYIGVGEGVSPGGPWWSGEGIESQKAIIESHLAPLLIDHEAIPLSTVVQHLNTVAYNNNFAKAALEMALFDAVGQRLGLPVSALLGAGPARTSIPVRWSIGSASVEDVVREGRARIEAGHVGVKLKMGAMPPPQDIERVAIIVVHLGPNVDYLVDPNGIWDLRTATWILGELESIGVSILEQPIRRDDIEGMATLTRRSTRVSIMADESICRPADALRVAAGRGCDSVAVKVAKAGGLLGAYGVGTIAAAAGLRCYGGTALESSIGTAASAHLFSTLPELSLGCELVGPLLLTDDLVVRPIRYENGELVVPTGAGLGVELDWSKVKEYQRR